MTKLQGAVRMNNQYDIIAIGAGPGGTVSAGLAAHEGKKVPAVDKNPSAGGIITTISDYSFFRGIQIQLSQSSGFSVGGPYASME